MPTRPHEDSVAEIYRKRPDLAIAVINELLVDGEPGEILILMRQLTSAFGGVAAVAEKSELHPTQLYRTLSADGNPTLSSLTALLKAMGMRLAVAPIKKQKPPVRAKTPARRKSSRVAA